jgi:K+-sensing histidine kinase KdpD
MTDQRRDSEHRSSPEALRDAARREERRVGKLRIFVSAAPDVGETYEMLQRARARKKDGCDVVVGITGLGLSIWCGFVEAMHGTIVAANGAARTGVMLTINPPIPRERQGLGVAA